MLTANDFHTALIQLMHRAGRGENVGPEVDDLIAQLEQTKISQSASEWRQGVANIRGSLMTHFGSAPISRDAAASEIDHAEVRRIYFVEAVVDRLARLMVRAA